MSPSIMVESKVQAYLAFYSTDIDNNKPFPSYLLSPYMGDTDSDEFHAIMWSVILILESKF